MPVNSLSIFGGDRTIQRNTFTDTDRLPAIRLRALTSDISVYSSTFNAVGVSNGGNVCTLDYHPASGQYIGVLGGPGTGTSTASTSGVNNFVYTSSDGKTWTQRTTPTTVGNPYVKRIGTNWIVGGVNGLITSPDGITWTNRTVPWGATALRSVTYNATLGVGVAITNGAIYYSTDNGVTWTSVAVPSGSGTPTMVTSFKGYLLLSTRAGANSCIYYSSNGSTWTACTIVDHLGNTLPLSAVTTSFNAVEANSDVATALSQEVTYYGPLGAITSFTSTDGITFTYRTAISPDFNFNPLYKTTETSLMLYQGYQLKFPPRATSGGGNLAPCNYFRVLNGKFILMAEFDTRVGLLISNDGISWTTIQPFVYSSGIDDGATSYLSMNVVKDQAIITLVFTTSSGNSSQWYGTNPNAKELVYVL